MASNAGASGATSTLSLHRLGVICGLAAGAWLGAAEAPTKLVTVGFSPFLISLGMVAGVFVARWTVPAALKGTGYIFQADGEVERTFLDLLKNLLQTGNDLLRIYQGNDALLAQHAGVGDGTADILVIEPLIELNRSGEFLNELIGGLGKTATPELMLRHIFPHLTA